MKRMLSTTLIAAFVVSLVLPGSVFAWDLTGFENSNKERGLYAWFSGQAETCNEEIPMPGSKSRAEWRELFTNAKDQLPCGGSGISNRVARHVFLFLYEHASDSNDPMLQKPESCG